jgi:hypothetical protein
MKEREDKQNEINIIKENVEFAVTDEERKEFYKELADALLAQ